MKVKGRDKIRDYRAHVIAEMTGLTIEQVRQLKDGKEIEVDETTGKALTTALDGQLAEVIPAKGVSNGD